MDTLFVHLPAGFQSAGLVTAWRRNADGLAALGEIAPDVLARSHPGSRCVVFLSTADCLLTRAEASRQQLRQAGAALAWLIEEQVGEDVDGLHVVAGPDAGNGETTLLAVASERLEAVLGALRTAGLRVLAVLPDLLLLPRDGSDWQLAAWPDGQLALRTGELAGAVLDADLLEAMLDAALREREAEAPTLTLTAAVDDAALRARLDAWLAAHPGVVCRFAEAADPVAVLQTVPDWTRQPANLLQGRFTVSEPFVVPAGLRMAAAFAAAALLVQLAGNWISYAYYHHQAARIEADAVTRYQQLFPDARAPASGRMAWLEKGLKSHLQGAAGGTTILPMLTRVATALQGSGLETQRIDYTGGVLTLDVDARALADIDSLKQRLGSRGFHAEIVSANAQGGLIRGRLRVGEGT